MRGCIAVAAWAGQVLADLGITVGHFCEDHLLCARQRPSNQDASAGAREEVERIVGQIRRRWPQGKNSDQGCCSLIQAAGVVVCLGTTARPSYWNTTKSMTTPLSAYAA